MGGGERKRFHLWPWRKEWGGAEGIGDDAEEEKGMEVGYQAWTIGKWIKTKLRVVVKGQMVVGGG